MEISGKKHKKSWKVIQEFLEIIWKYSLEGTEKNPWKHPDKIQEKSKEKFQEKESYWKTSWDISRNQRRNFWKVAPMVKCLENIRELSKVKCEIPGKQLGTARRLGENSWKTT